MIDPLIIAVIATVIGAGLNTVRGYMNSEEPYSARKLIGAIIVSSFAGVVIAQAISTSGLNPIAVIMLGLTSGFAVDYAVTKAKKV